MGPMRLHAGASSQFSVLFLKIPGIWQNAHKSRPTLRSVASRPGLHTNCMCGVTCYDSRTRLCIDCTHARTAIMWHVMAPAVAGVPQETHIQGMLQRVLGLRLQWRNRASGIQ